MCLYLGLKHVQQRRLEQTLTEHQNKGGQKESVPKRRRVEAAEVALLPVPSAPNLQPAVSLATSAASSSGENI